MYLSAPKARALSRVIQALAEPHSERDVREKVGHEVLVLLDADHYASYVWDTRRNVFGDRVALNMSDANLLAYEKYYQFRDPITHALQQRHGPTFVEEVMPQEQLVKTEFFNDFLIRDGLYWGVNLYAWDRGQNIGDMRIWRDRRRGRFDDDAIDVLSLLLPAFVAALRRCRPGVDEAVDAGPDIDGLLSPREADVADLACLGMSDKEIARRLGIAFPTVRTHLTKAFHRLGVSNRVQLALRLQGLRRAKR